MLFSKKSALLLSSAMLVSALGACSSGISTTPVALNADVNFTNSNLVTRISENVSVSKQDSNHFYIDSRSGITNGASITVKVDFASGGFNTKASSNGVGAKIAADVATFDVALINDPVSVSPTSLSAAPAAFGTVTKALGGGTAAADGTPGTIGSGKTSALITFTNVPENPGTGRYFVAIAAKDSGGVNITNPAGTLNNTFGSIVAGKYYVSTTGGIGGCMRVTKSVVGGRALYKVEYTSDLGVVLNLQDATSGANIGSVVTVNDGTQAITGSVVVG